MPDEPPPETPSWLRRPQRLLVGGSLVTATLALFAECCGSAPEYALLAADVALVCSWAVLGRPTLGITVVAVAVLTTLFGLLGGTPEPVYFQPILLAVAVGWLVPSLPRSVGYAVLLALAAPVGALAPDSHIGWWNWSIGTLFTWVLGRLLHHLDLALAELTEARSRLVAAAAMDERRRIARDVHDLVGHSLTAMLLNIRAARQTLESDPDRSGEALDDAVRIGQEGLAEVRSGMLALREPSPDGSAPTPAFAAIPDGESILELLGRQSDVTVSVDGAVGELRGPLAVTTFRILQECLTNIARHALPGSARLTLRIDGERVELRAENAIGAEARRASRDEADARRTLGLVGMRERVASLGGRLDARRVGERWRIDCELPRR